MLGDELDGRGSSMVLMLAASLLSGNVLECAGCCRRGAQRGRRLVRRVVFLSAAGGPGFTRCGIA